MTGMEKLVFIGRTIASLVVGIPFGLYESSWWAGVFMTMFVLVMQPS